MSYLHLQHFVQSPEPLRHSCKIIHCVLPLDCFWQFFYLPLITLCKTGSCVFRHCRETLLSFFGKGIDLCNYCNGKKHLFPHFSQLACEKRSRAPSPHNRSCKIKIVAHILCSIKILLLICSICDVNHDSSPTEKKY